MFDWKYVSILLIFQIVICFHQSKAALINNSVHRREFIELISSVSIVNNIHNVPSYSRQTSLLSPYPDKSNNNKESKDWPEDWSATQLNLLSIDEAVQKDSWEMGRWPDPLLRRPASQVPQQYFGTETLKNLVKKLKNTTRREGAVGLAAQQCGVDASVVYLETESSSNTNNFFNDRKVATKDKNDHTGIILINPRFVYRSSEIDMKVWEEFCLVLPSQFRATVLRDRDITLEAEDVDGSTRLIPLKGELARAAQHEIDHSNGILIVDHVEIEELPEYMRQLESQGHKERQQIAFTRSIVESHR